MHHDSQCWVWMAGFGLAWWLIASALLWASWNKVVATLVSVKRAQYWQALLIVLTMAFFCAAHHPRMWHAKMEMMHHHDADAGEEETE